MQIEKGLIGYFLLILLAALITTAVFLVIKSTDSIPGDLLYPIKGIRETWKVEQNELNFTYADRVEVYLDLTKARLSEVEKLIERKKYSSPDKTDYLISLLKYFHLPYEKWGMKPKNKDQEILDTIQRLSDTQAKVINNIQQAKIHNENIQVQLTKLEPILQEEQNNLPGLFYYVPQPIINSLQKIIDQAISDSRALDLIKKP